MLPKQQKSYVTTYCNFPHSTVSGRPIGHECIIIPPAALRAEMNDDYSTAIDIIQKSSRRLVRGRGGVPNA